MKNILDLRNKIKKTLVIRKDYLIIGIIGIILFLGGSLVKATEGSSFLDKVAKSAGWFLSEQIYGGIKDEVMKESEESFGASSGQNFDFPVAFNNGFLSGGVYTTSTSGSLLPLTAQSIQDVTLIDATLNQVDGEIRFPASTTLSSLLTKTGDSRTWYIRNASTTAAMDLKVASSTGIILNMGTTTNTIWGDTSPNKWARVTLTRVANTDFIGLLEIYLNK